MIITSAHPPRRALPHRLPALLGALLIALTALTALIAAPTAARADSSLPCDIYGAAGTPCVAAHSSVRALISGYNGPLYQVRRNTNGATQDIGLLSPGGYVNAAEQDAFCGAVSCTITKIYDQTSRHNDLSLAPAGTQEGVGASHGADANTLAITVAGHKAYGIWITQGSGYRFTGAANGVAVNGQPEGVYMVASGTHTANTCCFDYGNAEAAPADTGNGHMDAVSIATTCFFSVIAPCTGQGPWVEADMENGMFLGDNGANAANTGNASSYVTAMLKNNGQTTYALKGGNAQGGGLTTYYNGNLPVPVLQEQMGKGVYQPMSQEGGIILGIGGDNSDYSTGTFFEGVMTAGYPTDAADNAVQANITSVGYSGQTAIPNNPHSIQSGATATILDHNGATVTYALGADGNIDENYQTVPGGGGWKGWELYLNQPNGPLAPFVSAPSVFVDSAGHTVVTAIDTTGNVEEDYQTVPAAAPWSGWHYYNHSALPAGVRFIGTPYATHDASGVNVTYATGTDGNVYEDFFTRSKGTWSGWETALTDADRAHEWEIVSPPSVFVDGTGHVVVTAIDSSGNVLENYQVNPGTAPWSGWHTYNNSPLPAGVRFIGTPFSTHDDNNVNVTWVTGTDGNVYEDFFTRATGNWSGWELNLNLGRGGESFVSSPSGFADSVGKMVVTALDSSGNLQETYQQSPRAAPWTGWHTYTNSPMPAGVTFMGMPNSLKDKNGTNVTYVLGSDGKEYENYLVNHTWFGWELALGTPPVFLGQM
ncbi:hypothetical protein ABH926_006288 [Catenulispora sp. GP43]|uniref:arabinofuranosidase catalytic domain-containing protein n=1 Tax=Catenulispora sp. GP43 TaxID=3156263 RepID=UPI0035177D71